MSLSNRLARMATSIANLNALRAFEATARKSSFTLAAQELCVTQAAVSHQIRQIEETLGIRLFERAHRRVVLTPAGERLLKSVSAAFGEIDGALRDLREAGNQRTTVTVQVTPSFGSRWLARRLHSFWAAHPEIDLRIYHALPHEQHDAHRVDMAVKWGTGNWPSMRSEKLLGAVLLPVCSPAYLRPDAPLDKAADLFQYTLLHEDSYDEWGAWFRAAGLAQPMPPRGTIIDDTNTLLEAALNLQGIALGRLPLVHDQLEQGLLVSPFDLAIECEGAYYLVYDEKYAEHSAFAKFRSFLLDQVRGFAPQTVASSVPGSWRTKSPT